MLTVRMIPINRLARTPDCMAEIPREECRIINVEESYQNSHSREAGSSEFHTSLGQIQAPDWYDRDQMSLEVDFVIVLFPVVRQQVAICQR